MKRSNKIKIATGNDIKEVINKPFSSVLTTYQIGLETSTKGSDFVFDYVDGLHYKCHKIILHHGGL